MSGPRGRAGQYGPLYASGRWRKIRAQQLRNEPLCAFCEAKGRVTEATVCDHIEAHRGDMEKFWSGPFQSLCSNCHNSTKQTIEKSGKTRAEIGVDGWPLDGVKPPGGDRSEV